MSSKFEDLDNPFEDKSESTIVTSIRKTLYKNFGGVWYKIHGGPYQEAGIPDIVGCCHGKFFALEVKRPSKLKNVSPQQQYQLDRLHIAGGCVAVVTSPEEATAFVRKALVGDVDTFDSKQ